VADVQGVAGLKLKQLSERSARRGMRVPQNTMHWTDVWQLFREMLG